MPFERLASIVPATVGEIRIRLVDRNGTPTEMGAFFMLQVLAQDGTICREINGDLIPHLTTVQRDGLIQLMQDLRALAISEILPT